jgi:hypothetical protein
MMQKINVIFEKNKIRYSLILTVKKADELIIYLSEIISFKSVLITIQKNNYNI